MTAYLLPLLISIHLIDLVFMAGTTVADFIGYRKLLEIRSNVEQAGFLYGFTRIFPRLIGIGAALLIAIGIGMMALTNGVFGEQLWFRTKFGLVLLLILNGVVIGRRHMIRFREALLTANDTFDAARKQHILSVFYASQYLFFAAIILLSVFKFN